MVADSESLLADFLFGAELREHQQTSDILAKLAKVVHAIGGGPTPPDAVALCREIDRQLREREAQFVEDMRQVISKLNPACKDWNPFAADPIGRDQALSAVRGANVMATLASAYVIKAHLLSEVPVSDTDLEKMSEAAVERFGPSLFMYLRLLEHIIITGSDMSKPQRMNTIWDMQILMGLGQQIDDTPGALTLVTGDAGIVRAAERASAEEYVWSLDEYLAALVCSLRLLRTLD